MPLDPKTWKEPIEGVSVDKFALAYSFFYLNHHTTGLRFKTSGHSIHVREVLGMRKSLVEKDPLKHSGTMVVQYRISGKCMYRDQYDNGPYWAYEGRFVATYREDTGKGDFRFFQENSWSGTDES